MLEKLIQQKDAQLNFVVDSCFKVCDPFLALPAAFGARQAKNIGGIIAKLERTAQFRYPPTVMVVTANRLQINKVAHVAAVLGNLCEVMCGG
jgi:hypothetical protein